MAKRPYTVRERIRRQRKAGVVVFAMQAVGGVTEILTIHSLLQVYHIDQSPLWTAFKDGICEISWSLKVLVR